MPLLDKIRDEIIETQKTQASFARWKLLLVAALGAAGLGIASEEPNGRSTALLSLLPVVCVYADSLIFNSGIRMLAIARYLRVHAKWPGDAENLDEELGELAAARDYERFCRENRHHFDLEVVALQGVTFGVALIVLVIGVLNFFSKSLPIKIVPRSSPAEAVLLILFSLLGGLVAWFLYRRHRRKISHFDEQDVVHTVRTV